MSAALPSHLIWSAGLNDALVIHGLLLEMGLVRIQRTWDKNASAVQMNRCCHVLSMEPLEGTYRRKAVLWPQEGLTPA